MLKALLFVCTVGIIKSIPLSDEITPRSGETCGYESCTKTEPGILNIHIVPHTHDDVGWLKTVDQYYYGSRNNIQKAGVQYILDSVIKELWEDPKRRFIYVETAFFWKWWVRQSDSVRHKVHALVRQGRLQFVGGAWSMNDEAATHYQSTIDQFTWGHRKLNQTFGRCGVPRVGWQIDPFGHAREFASLLAAMGYDGLFLGRIDYQDKRTRLNNKNMEMVWRGDDNLGKSSDIFTGVLYNTYSPPSGFCFDVLCNDEPIIDDPNSPLYNVERRVKDFLEVTKNMSKAYRTQNILITMGEDFQYQDAAMWYTNLDKLIEYTNLKAAKDGLDLKMFYSTPDCYLKAVKDANPTLPTKQDDFFPYASDSTAYWTGYFTSRPTTKYFEREGNNYLQILKQLQVLAGLEDHNKFVLDELKSAMGVMQHHDAITGTEKEHVTHDYERLLDGAIEDALSIARQAFSKISQDNRIELPLLSYERCRFNESRCDTTENSQEFVVTVYNPLGWILKDAYIRLPVIEGDYLIYDPTGKEVTSQLVELPTPVLNIPTRESKATQELVFPAENLPPLGFRSYYVKKNNNKVKRETENDALVNTKCQGKRKNDDYANINDYWKNIRDKSFVDIKNIEEDAMYKNPELLVNVEEDIEPKLYFTKLNIPDEPKFELDKEPDSLISTKKRYELPNGDFDFKILKDKKQEDSNRDIEELEKLLKEANRRMVNIAQRPRNDAEKKINYPSLNDDEMRMLSDDPLVVQRYPEDRFFENKNIKLRINESTGEITHVIQPDGTESRFNIQLLYYPGCVGNNAIPANRSSGAYIFRPNATKPYELFQNDSKYIDGAVVKEIHYARAPYVSGVVRLYANADYLEHEWLVGPIPIEDDIGKEIVVRYDTDVINNGEFYTDSNGRQVLKRRLNQRPQWNVTLEEPIAGNYYPVTNEIYIEDGDDLVAVLTDRSQGGSSLIEGQIELMLHRRLLRDDAFGVGEALNETAKGVGLVVRGTHKVFFKINTGEKRLKLRQRVLENHLKPQIFVSDAKDLDLQHWLGLKNEFSGVKTALPRGLHLLTLEPWDASRLLLRLENFLEVSDEESTVEIDLSQIFNTIKIESVRETTLSANQWTDEYTKWEWSKENGFSENFNKQYGNFAELPKAEDNDDVNADDGLNIKVKPKQIRTFIVKYALLNNF